MSDTEQTETEEEERSEEEEEEEAEAAPQVEVRTKAERIIEDQQGPDGYERRDITGTEFRQQDEGTITGFPAVFNEPHDIGQMKEVFREGMFSKTLQEGGIVALFNHDPNLILGRDEAGTLELSETNRGLFMEVDTPDSPLGQNVSEAVKRGDVEGGSIGMKVKRQSIEQADDGEPIREIEEVDLRDVGPVTFPASGSTGVEARDATGLITRADMAHDIDLYRLFGALSRTTEQEVREEDAEIIERAATYLQSLSASDRTDGGAGKERLLNKLDTTISVLEQ